MKNILKKNGLSGLLTLAVLCNGFLLFGLSWEDFQSTFFGKSTISNKDNSDTQNTTKTNSGETVNQLDGNMQTGG